MAGGQGEPPAGVPGPIASPDVPQLDLCPACRQPGGAGAACNRCGADLRVDLCLDGAAADERARFLIARELGALGLPGLEFGTVRRQLASPGAPLARGLSRTSARTAIEALARRGFPASARPPTAAPAGPTAKLGPTMRTAVLMLALAASAGIWRATERQHPPPAPAAVVAAAPTPTPAAAAASPAPAALPAATPAAAAPAARLTTQEIAARTVGSTAEISCLGRLGTAFFVAAERAVTNAHVTCGREQPVQVRMKDGREFAGKVAVIDKPLDFAVIEVVGAAAKPIELGDSTTLAAGDPVALIGNPHALSFTAHEGKVSYVGRNLLGNAYVQINADVNPGNSGGPLLDGGARVVGIVSMKEAGADGIGLALPIEYVRPFIGSAIDSAPSVSPDAQARWQATLERVRAEDAREVEQYRSKYLRPTLVAAGPGADGGLTGIVLRRFEGSPTGLDVTVEVRADDKTLCRTETRVREWEKVELSFEKALKSSPDQPRLAWAAQHQILRGVFAGAAPLDLGRCTLHDVPGSAIIVIPDGDQSEAPVRFPRTALAENAGLAEARRELRAKVDSRRAAEDEMMWRSTFKRVRGAIAALEAAKRNAEAAVERSLPNARSDPRDRLADIEAQLGSARDALAELERQASAASVPRAWRE